MKKKVIAVAFLAQALLVNTMQASAHILSGDTAGSVEFYRSFPTTEDGRAFISRNPLNPAQPFPAADIFRTNGSEKHGYVDGVWGQLQFDHVGDLWESDTIDFGAASAETPKLFSDRAYLREYDDIDSGFDETWNVSGLGNVGIVHTPFMWDFGNAEILGNGNGTMRLHAQGDARVYQEDYSFLQIWDNRETHEGGGWAVHVQLADHPTASDGAQLVGATIGLPQATARNEFNTNPSQADNRFVTQDAIVGTIDPVTVMHTRGVRRLTDEGFNATQIAATGRGMTTLTWNTEDIFMDIPTRAINGANDYLVILLWTMTRSPEY